MSDKERLELLEKALIEIKISFPWMVKTLRHAADELHEGNYLDDLKHAIIVDDFMKDL